MDDDLKRLLEHLGKVYKERIDTKSRHYIEVNLGQQAREIGLENLSVKLKDAYAVIPLKEPIPGMKVRIDGRTFVDYCLHPCGFAVPGYVVKDAGIDCPKYTANDSMILNCT